MRRKPRIKITNEKLNMSISENILSQNYLEVGLIDLDSDTYTRYHSLGTNIDKFKEARKSSFDIGK